MAENGEDGQSSSFVTGRDTPKEDFISQALRVGCNLSLEVVKGFYRSGSNVGTVKISGIPFGPEMVASMLFHQLLADQGKEVLPQDAFIVQDTTPPITLLIAPPTGRIGRSLLIMMEDIMMQLKPTFPGIHAVSSVHRALQSTNEPHVSKTIDNALTILEGVLPHAASTTFPHADKGNMLCLVTGLDRVIQKSSERANQAGRLVRFLENLFVVNGKGKLIFFTGGDCKAIEYLASPGGLVQLYQGGR